LSVPVGAWPRRDPAAGTIDRAVLGSVDDGTSGLY